MNKCIICIPETKIVIPNPTNVPTNFLMVRSSIFRYTKPNNIERTKQIK